MKNLDLSKYQCQHLKKRKAFYTKRRFFKRSKIHIYRTMITSGYDSINLSHIHINAPKDSGGIGLHRKNAHTCQTHLGPHMLSIC